MSFSVIKWFSQSPEPSTQPKVELKASELVELCLEFDFQRDIVDNVEYCSEQEIQNYQTAKLALKTFCENHNIEWDYE